METKSMPQVSSLTFITGGARSGKSSFAEELAVKSAKDRVYIATMQGLDEEMKKRIKRHKKQRGEGWCTVEEPLDLLKSVKSGDKKNRVILIDCLTLWVSNRMMKGEKEKEILTSAEEIAKYCAGAKAEVIAVSNEVGMGLVPDNKLGRDFRDIQGRVNRIFAERAAKVFFLVSGIPLEVKK
ncbi:MAG: bifunctional adenosylcobinamide kinase/adenosylcobinamide-phosphate guanylyltransferase [Candidatus Firestonebacteria bacterium RIFOXYC2_FULL_39_67]|nr:MAG: bifunctional adenosylcobinamide kinase/adenosylcobinamide-phosphate guanylyltransferase [Candidatus Firestonebacteria bacterium RIFOXYD2_FULL_39_29]OGF56802.1 MAG: bifunctional adenosylcobinamide kinase/adenosylcobinamide-phosphate guanylyltransferase [Candidatus Firestonebacteria bacterium RIFOXYC2_FULL_39_67]